MNAAKSMGLAYPSLRKFLRGGDVRGASIDKMLRWLQRWGAPQPDAEGRAETESLAGSGLEPTR